MELTPAIDSGTEKNERVDQNGRNDRWMFPLVLNLAGFQGSVDTSSGCAADSLSTAPPSKACIPTDLVTKTPASSFELLHQEHRF